MRHCYEEMQKQAHEACVAVAKQTAAVRGNGYVQLVLMDSTLFMYLQEHSLFKTLKLILD